jgi:hypothetical protein
MYNVENMQANYVDTSITQWEQYLLTKISQDLKLHLDLPGVWWNLHLSDDGVKVIASWNSKTIMIMSSSNLYNPDSRWFVIQKKGATEQAMRSHITGSPGGQRNVRMGHYIRKNYDKLIQQLYVAGRSDFLHLNPTE